MDANPENDYFIGDNLGISRFHTIIKTTNGEYTLVDENSKNYTYVNDSRIQPYIPVMLKMVILFHLQMTSMSLLLDDRGL